jgi:transposase-like protein
VGAAAAADSDATSDELVSQRDELRERRASHQRDEVLERARELAATGMSIRAIAHEVGISRTTLTRKLAATGG